MQGSYVPRAATSGTKAVRSVLPPQIDGCCLLLGISLHLPPLQLWVREWFGVPYRWFARIAGLPPASPSPGEPPEDGRRVARLTMQEFSRASSRRTASEAEEDALRKDGTSLFLHTILPFLPSRCSLRSFDRTCTRRMLLFRSVDRHIIRGSACALVTTGT